MIKKFGIQLAVLVIIILGAMYLSFNSDILQNFLPNSSSPQSSVSQIKVGETVINVEIADNASKRTQGLSGRQSLASDSGMLFVFPESKRFQFWMKDMKFPLDFVFIKDGKVVDLMRNIPPPAPGQLTQNLPIYEPSTPIDMMLEVNSGFIDSHGIKIGDSVFKI